MSPATKETARIAEVAELRSERSIVLHTTPAWCEQSRTPFLLQDRGVPALKSAPRIATESAPTIRPLNDGFGYFADELVALPRLIRLANSR